MEKTIIFLDIDGVIGDFDAHAVNENKYKDNGKLDHDALDFKWWSTMPVVEGANDFYDTLTNIAEVKFLTGPMVSVDCFGGKAAWISQKFLPQKGKWALTDLIICHSKRKGLLAGPTRILIDDTKANVDAWRQAGGIGIYHEGDFSKTLMLLQKELKKLKPSQPSFKR